MAVDVGSAVGYLDLDISGFLAGLKSAQNEADTTSKSIATKIGNNISGAGKKLTSAGKTLTKNVTIPLLGVGVAGLKVATDFEKGMSEVKAISGATGKSFDALKDKAIELGASTAFSAGEVAEAMTEMAKAGWSSQQIIDGMGGVLDAAAASGEGLAIVSTIVADAITGFGMEAKESTKVADLLTQAANSGTIGITDLGESFKYVAPVAGSMGLSIEDVTTAISAMSMAGIKGSQAGTSLRTMLVRMVKPTDAVKKAMDKLNIVLTKEDGSFKSLDEIVSEMRTSFSDLTDEQKTYYAATLAGQEGMSGLLSLLNLTEEEYDAIAKSMNNANGVAQETAKVMQDNLQSKVEQLGGSLESLAIKLADYVIPYVQKFVEWLTDLIDKFTSLDPETQKTILKFAGIAIAAGPVLAVIGKLVTGVGGFITTLGKIPGAVSKLNTGFTTLTTGLKNIGEGFNLAKAGYSGLATQAGGLGTQMGVAAAGITGSTIAIIAIIALLVAAFISLWKTNEEFRDNITAIWEEIKATFEKLTTGIVERLNKLGFDFENIGEVLKAVWKGVCDLLGPYFEGVFNYIAIIFDFYVNQFLTVLDFFISLFTGDWEGCWDAIKNYFINIWTFVKDWFLNILNVFTGILDVVLGWFGTSWTECWDSIKTFFINIWTNISTFFTNTWNTIKNIVQVGIMFIVELVKAWFNLVTIPFRFIWENCKETIISVWDSIKTVILSVLTVIKNIITTAWNDIKLVITTVINVIKMVITTVFNAIKTVVTNIFNKIKDAISGPINAAKTIITNIINNIKTIISDGFASAKDTVASIFNKIKDAISGPMDKAKQKVTDVINSIKEKFNFNWSLPKLKMPHLKISGSFSLNPPSVPKFSIEWYKKAMNNGMILNTATIFGFNQKTGKFLAGGEAGSETVVGTKSLMSMIKKAVAEVVGPLVKASIELAKTSADLGYITYNGFVKLKEMKEIQREIGYNDKGNGDTFVFYSPKSIDEIEAAKQMKKAKRELAEGF